MSNMSTSFEQWLPVITNWRFDIALGAVSALNQVPTRKTNSIGTRVQHTTIRLSILLSPGCQVSRAAAGFCIQPLALLLSVCS